MHSSVLMPLNAVERVRLMVLGETEVMIGMVPDCLCQRVSVRETEEEKVKDEKMRGWAQTETQGT
jgi:hypothetical protein